MLMQYSTLHGRQCSAETAKVSSQPQPTARSTEKECTRQPPRPLGTASSKLVTEERWVKAHVADELAKLAKTPDEMQSRIDSMTKQEKLDAYANSMADDAAKDAMTEDIANSADQ